MPRPQDVDAITRARIRAWLAYYKARRGWTNERLSKELDLAEPTITNILNDKRSAGLDVVIKMHRRLHKSADDILDTDPPEDSS
jgi:transcriptional regulator with XRE-family HTH domain